MGLETMALIAHSLDRPQLQTLTSRLAHETGQEWSWDDAEPAWKDTSLLDLWHKNETLFVRGPEANLWIGPRASVLDLYQRLHYGDVSKSIIAKCHQLISDVARAFGSAASFVVPDTGYDMSEAVGWPHDGWSMGEIYEVLARFYAETPKLEQMVELDDDETPNTVAFGHLRWNETELIEPATTFDATSGAALPEPSLQGFTVREMHFDEWNSRLLLSGSLLGEWPPNQYILLSEIRSDARLLLIGVEELRYVRHRSKTREVCSTNSDWLLAFREKNPQANPALKHYSFGALEALAISHILEITTATDNGPSGSIIRLPHPVSSDE